MALPDDFTARIMDYLTGSIRQALDEYVKDEIWTLQDRLRRIALRMDKLYDQYNKPGDSVARTAVVYNAYEAVKKILSEQ